MNTELLMHVSLIFFPPAELLLTSHHEFHRQRWLIIFCNLKIILIGVYIISCIYAVVLISAHYKPFVMSPVGHRYNLSFIDYLPQHHVKTN